MIEMSTVSAARLKICSPSGMSELSTSRENVMVATPPSAEPAREGARGEVELRAQQRHLDRHGARHEEGEGRERDRRGSLGVQAVEGQEGPEDHEHPELGQLDHVLGAALEADAQVRAAYAQYDRAHEDGDETPPPSSGR